MVRVLVEDLEVYAYHGVSDEEQTVGHRYLVDIDVELRAKNVSDDSLERSIDYAVLCELAQRVLLEKKYRTLEHVATILAKSILDRSKNVAATEVYVRKLAPPMPHIAHSAGVVVRLEQ